MRSAALHLRCAMAARAAPVVGVALDAPATQLTVFNLPPGQGSGRYMDLEMGRFPLTNSKSQSGVIPHTKFGDGVVWIFRSSFVSSSSPRHLSAELPTHALAKMTTQMMTGKSRPRRFQKIPKT